MKIYDHIKRKLESTPSARERRFRDQHLVDLILEKHGKHSMFVDINFLPEFAKDFVSYERVWRQVLQNEESLRGDDYGDKEVLEQQVQIDLDYQAGYKQLVNGNINTQK